MKKENINKIIQLLNNYVITGTIKPSLIDELKEILQAYSNNKEATTNNYKLIQKKDGFNDKKYITAQVASILLNCSIRTIYDMANANKLKKHYTGEGRRFKYYLLEKEEVVKYKGHSLHQDDDYITTKEACKILGKHRATICRLTREGKLTKHYRGIKNGRFHLKKSEVKALCN